LTLHRFPDSEILGSKPVSGSPRLIAAAHVLHRLSTPRHPPYALSSLTVSLRHERVFQSKPRFHPGTFSLSVPKIKNKLLRTCFLLLVYSVFKERSAFALRASARLFAWTTVLNPSIYNSEGLRIGVQVELDGLEPTTPGLQSRCSPN
jgi:hypothetical protein